MNSIHFPEAWASWEIDPSTRTSVHVWTKYVAIDTTVGTTATDIFTVDRGIPSVNLVQNPSFEVNTLTDFTVLPVGGSSTIAQSNAQAASGTYSLLVTTDNNAAGEGFYWPLSTVGHPEGSSITAQAEVRRVSGAGATVQIQIQNDSGTVLATSAAHTLDDTFTRISVSYPLPFSSVAPYRIVIVTAAQTNVNYYVDKFMVEQRRDGQLVDYVDGAQGVNYEWFGTAHASESKRRAGMITVRGFRLKNGHGSNTVNIALDTTATAAGTTSTGVLLKNGETWEPPWSIDVRQRISAIASGASTQIYGVIWGIHEG